MPPRGRCGSTGWTRRSSPGRLSEGDRQVDVAIVGGGFSGLWTAYYLIRADPSLRITVLERHYCGFGASGRNGGWACGEVGGSTGGTDRTLRPPLRRTPRPCGSIRAVFDAVDEIQRDLGFARGSTCDYARGRHDSPGAQRPPGTSASAKRSTSCAPTASPSDEIRLLDASEARRYLNATDVRSGILLGPSAALDPAKLVTGSGRRRRIAAGVAVYEQTTVTGTRPGARVHTEGGTVSADVVVRATEAYTRDLAGPAPGAPAGVLPDDRHRAAPRRA